MRALVRVFVRRLQHVFPRVAAAGKPAAIFVTLLLLSATVFAPHALSVTSCTLELKTIPNAPRDQVAGWLGDILKVKVHAPALDGRANEALLEFLAGELGLPKRAITLIRGDKSRHKVVRLHGLTLVEVRTRLVVSFGGG